MPEVLENPEVNEITKENGPPSRAGRMEMRSIAPILGRRSKKVLQLGERTWKTGGGVSAPERERPH